MERMFFFANAASPVSLLDLFTLSARTTDRYN